MGILLSKRHNEVEGERSRCRKCNQHEELEELRSALRVKENDLKSAKERSGMEAERHLAHRCYKEELERNRSAWNKERQRFSELEAFYKQELNKERLQSQSLLLRSKCQQCEQQEYQHKQKLTEMEIFYKGKLNEERTVLKQNQEELTSFKKRVAAMITQNENLKKEISAWQREKQRSTTEEVRSKCQECERRDREHKQSLNEIMAFYKEKLNKTESALKQTEAELKSFKHRVAANMAVSIKTSNPESMNNPVSKTRLTEMYDNLKLLQWPKVKDQLKSRKINPEDIKGLIQKVFAAASEEMKRKKQHMEAAFGLTESSSGLTSQKVKEYRQLTVQNLQMVMFHTNKEELLKIGFSQFGGPNSEEVMVDLRPLMCECYWLSCLMSLNNPPLQPDWENHVPSMDSWDIFPRDIKPYAAV